MNEYTASNGVKVIALGGGLAFQLPMRGVSTFGINSEKVEALREFFQHERDEELGRWRWPENPDYVVYPDAFDSDPDWVAVVNEEEGKVGSRARGHVVYPENLYHRAGAAYFEAHPERKPWHDAKTGEVWVITVDGEESAWAVNNAGRFENPDSTYEPTNVHITAARRIWPVSD